MTRKVVVTQNAEDDLVAIYKESRRRFGVHQAKRYASAMRHAIHTELADFPFMGPSHPDLGEGVRSLHRQAHYIFYQVDDEVIRVLRILYHRMKIEPDMLH